MPTTTTPHDFIQTWAKDTLGLDDGVPSMEILNAIANTVGAVQEFMLGAIVEALRAMSASAHAADDARRRGLTPEGDRMFDYADVGRLIDFADRLRVEIKHLHDTVAAVALLAHEDVATIAGGYCPVEPGACLDDKSLREQLERFHGLDTPVEAV